MDQEILVNPQVEDGKALVAELTRDGHDVFVAFWAKLRDEDASSFYLGLSDRGFAPPENKYHAVYGMLARIPHATIAPADVVFIEAANPVAVDAIRIRDRSSAWLATRYRGKTLGHLAIDEAYIYPDRATSMSADQVVEVLLGRFGDRTPAQVTLRDGTKIEGVPFRIDRGSPGGVRIVLRDPGTGSDREIGAQDVASVL